MGLGKKLIGGSQQRRYYLFGNQIRIQIVGGAPRNEASTSAPRSNSLAEAFNNKTSPGLAESAVKSILRQKKQTGLFCREELMNPESFAKLNLNVRSEASALLEEIKLPLKERTRKTVEVLDDISNSICKSADLAECIRLLHESDKWKAAAQESMEDFTELVETFNTNKSVYESLLEEFENGGPPQSKPADEVDRRITELFLEDFRQSGIHFKDNEANEFVWLSSEIFRLGSLFTPKSDEPVEIADYKQPPVEALRSLRSEHGFAGFKRRHYLDSPLTHSPDPATRKWSYETYHQVSESQEKILKELVFRRSQLATLAGFQNFAARSQVGTLFETPEDIDEFLCGVHEALLPESRRELYQLFDPNYFNPNSAGDKNRMSQDGDDKKKEELIGVWDYPYYSGLYKQEKFGLNPERFNEFLLPGNVMDAMGSVVKRLYGISLKPVPSLIGEIWQQSVQKLEAVDADGRMLGTIYCDFYDRPGKFGGDAHFTVRCSKQLPSGELQSPIVVLSLTLPGTNLSVHPVVGETLFHEMGHAMHSMLGQTKYQHVSGTRCATDLAETPSNLMERFFYCPQVLSQVLWSTTGPQKSTRLQSLPLEYAESICRSNKAFAATDILQQSAYALFDIRLHCLTPEELHDMSTVQFFHDIVQKSVPLAQLPQTAWHHRFSHLVSYPAKYYSYTVAKALSCLLWQKLFEQKPFSRESGLRWAKAQSYGGEKPTGAILEEMLGFRPESGHLIEALHKHVQK